MPTKRKRNFGTQEKKERFIKMLNSFLNNDTINPFQTIITANDLKLAMIKYTKSKYSDTAGGAYVDDDDLQQRYDPRVFGKQFGFILRYSKTPYKIIDQIRLRRGLVYKFNFARLRRYLVDRGWYDAKFETLEYKAHFPPYLKFVSQPFNDSQLMDRLYSDFLFDCFINNDTAAADVQQNHVNKSNESKLPFLGVLAFPLQISMPLTQDALFLFQNKIILSKEKENVYKHTYKNGANESSGGGDNNVHKNSDQKLFSISGMDFFCKFKSFLKQNMDSQAHMDVRVVRSNLSHIHGNLSQLHFGADMERFLFGPKLGLKTHTNQKVIYNLLIDDILHFLHEKLKHQLQTQEKQLDIQERSANQEYEDFTDDASSTDEDKDNVEMERRECKRIAKNKTNAKSAKSKAENKGGARGDKNWERDEALLNWEMEDIEDRTNGMTDADKVTVTKQLHGYHVANKRSFRRSKKATSLCDCSKKLVTPPSPLFCSPTLAMSTLNQNR